MKFEMRMDGLDELQQKLEEMKRRTEQLDGEKVSFDKLFPPEFMTQYTNHASIQSMIAASRWKVESQDDFAAIPDDEWDAYVRQETKFGSWKEMQEKAVAEHVGRELGLK